MGGENKEKNSRFFKIPQNKRTLKANVYLAVGFVFVVAGAFMLAGSFVAPETAFAIRPLISLIVGALFLFFAFAFTESGAFLFAGLSFIVFGVLTLLIDTKITSLGIKELWPVQVVGCGVALIPSGLYTQHRIRSIYLFPAIMLMCLGTIFLMFSLNVIKVSLAVFVGTWWPVLLIIGGISMICIFLVQKSKYKILPYMEDDSLVDGD